jgi:seryl-tRNA synthetase
MLDIQKIRDNPKEVKKSLSRRGDEPPIDRILELDSARRGLLTEVEILKAERNKVSKEIGKMKDEAERQERIDAMRELGTRIDKLDTDVKEVEAELHELMIEVPNLPDPSVPDGPDESANVVVRSGGEPKHFVFDPKPHWELGPELGIINFEQGVKITGSRYYVLSGAGARLQRALIAWMLDVHIRQGYLEKYTPYLVKEQTLFAAGELPQFKHNLYKDHEEDRWMIPTAEVSLTGLHMDEILDRDSLPRYYTAYSACFRREKMSAGRDVRGIKRGHQFDKVEMYTFCEPESSMQEQERMLEHAVDLVKQLGFAYRILELSTGDLGFKATKTYDIEIWSPGVHEWLEVSSISNCTDFQARRANTRFRADKGERTQFVHTLNGSGLALPRTLIGVLENYQQKDGSVVIPEVLRPWMGGVDLISPEG